MMLGNVGETQCNLGTALSSASGKTRWYAAYTCANHEKRVAAQLSARDIEHFLPLYPSARRWKDRRVTLDLPLFPGYVFVRMALYDRLKVETIPGVARLVGFDGRPAALPDGEIEVLQAGLTSGVKAEPHAFLKAGRRMRVKTGPLAGLEGIFMKRKNRMWLVLSVELVHRSVGIEVDEANVQLM